MFHRDVVFEDILVPGGPKTATRGCNEAKITPALWGGFLKWWVVPNKPMGCFLLKMNSTWGGVLGVLPFEPRKKTLLLSIESWLVNRDPYNGLL